MAAQTPANLIHHESRQTALVLEGIAGTLHEGRPVELEDLQDAAQVAEWVWEAVPKPSDARAADFEAAHTAFVGSIEPCALGMAHESSIVGHAAQRMATQLRRSAEESLRFANRKELPSAVDESLTRLARAYASHSLRSGST